MKKREEEVFLTEQPLYDKRKKGKVDESACKRVTTKSVFLFLKKKIFKTFFFLTNNYFVL